jgi:hypothetical protein
MQINHQIAAHSAKRDHRPGADDIKRELGRGPGF